MENLKLRALAIDNYEQFCAEIERLRDEIESYEAMKEGVQIRIADLEAEIERLDRLFQGTKTIMSLILSG